MGNLDGWPVVLGFDILFDSEFSIDSDLSDLSFSAQRVKVQLFVYILIIRWVFFNTCSVRADIE